LGVAKKADKVKMSTCSEVVLAEVEEDVFETPFDLADLEVSHQKIHSVTEQPAMPTHVVSALESPKVHTMHKIAVKVTLLFLLLFFRRFLSEAGIFLKESLKHYVCLMIFSF
jgi:hypothetical protein